MYKACTLYKVLLRFVWDIIRSVLNCRLCGKDWSFYIYNVPVKGMPRYSHAVGPKDFIVGAVMQCHHHNLPQTDGLSRPHLPGMTPIQWLWNLDQH